MLSDFLYLMEYPNCLGCSVDYLYPINFSDEGYQF
jgi:hypothetical protein